MKKKNYYHKKKELSYNCKAMKNINSINNIQIKSNYQIYYIKNINLNLRKKILKNKYLKLISK